MRVDAASLFGYAQASSAAAGRSYRWAEALVEAAKARDQQRLDELVAAWEEGDPSYDEPPEQEP